MPRRNVPEKSLEAPLGARVAEERLARGWSMEQLAKEMTAAGCTAHGSAVFRLESGSRKVSVDELVALSAIYGVRPEVLLGTAVEDAEERKLRVDTREARDAVTAAEEELLLARVRLAALVPGSGFAMLDGEQVMVDEYPRFSDQ